MLVGISVMVVLIVGVSRTDIFINDIFCVRFICMALLHFRFISYNIQTYKREIKY